MKKICALLLTFLFLLTISGCAQAEAPENPYRMKTYIRESYDRDGTTQTIWIEYAYDENGWNESIQTYYDDVLDNTQVFSRDTYGNLTATTQTNADGTQTTSKEVLTLDDQHRVIYSETYQYDGTLFATTEYGYNKDGLTTKLNINRIGALNGEDWKSFVDRTYDRKGNLTREDVRWESSDISTGYSLFTYDQQGKLLRIEEYQNEELTAYIDHSYDETGLIRTSLTCDADGTVEYKSITTFDPYGNELERITYDYYTEQMRYGQTDEEPDSRSTYIYELTEP